MLCSSQAAAAAKATCEEESMEEASSSSAASAALSSSSPALLLGGGGPAIDRHNPIIRDSKRWVLPLTSPCVDPQPPVISPKPHRFTLHRKKIKNVPAEMEHKFAAKNEKSSDLKKINGGGGISLARRSWSCVGKPNEFSSPVNSTRYLLSNDKALSDFEPTRDFDPTRKITFPDEKPREAAEEVSDEESCGSKEEQVVILRVFLDCRGCEKKMRKHISRMRGVTSFDIDFASKKVTVTGKLTPLEVLTSISKVKKAQVWSPSPTAPFI